MSDVACPYCGTDQEINHDDGCGYEEDEHHEQGCVSCDKTFKFVTSISYTYRVYCDGEHDMRKCPISRHGDLWDCARCDYFEVRK